MQRESIGIEAGQSGLTATTAPDVRFVDLRAQFASIKDEITDRILEVLDSQHLILGPEVDGFEKEIAAWNASRYAVGCASGSDALLLALMALGVQSGDEVITTPFTFVATVGCIARLGAKPVFIDIDPETFNLDPAKLSDAITPKTRAVIAVHLFGCPADLDGIRSITEANSIPVVEDAAQAIGAKWHNKLVGNIGTIGCFSFFPAKNLGCAGDGGLVVTNDDALADRIRVLRSHGSRKRYNYELIGMNSRLDALQAAILRVKLRHLNDWTEGRRRNAENYTSLFSDFGLEKHVCVPETPEHAYHVYNQFTIRTSNRDRLRSHLSACGIPTEVYYPSPLHLQSAFSYLGYRSGAFPESERACRELVSLPIYPELPFEQQVFVVREIARFFEANA